MNIHKLPRTNHLNCLKNGICQDKQIFQLICSALHPAASNRISILLIPTITAASWTPRYFRYHNLHRFCALGEFLSFPKPG